MRDVTSCVKTCRAPARFPSTRGFTPSAAYDDGSRPATALAIAVCCGGSACKTLFHGDSGEPLPVARAAEEVVVAAWSEPKELPPGGGQAQVLVLAQKRGGAPFPGVEVRLRASAGSLFSGGRILITDASGRTRDRLTTHGPSLITVNAGGTVYRFRVPVRASEAR
jgi:hypothetical protein